LPELSVAICLSAWGIFFFWPILTAQAVFPPGDFAEQFYAFAAFKARELAAGHLPLWNPYTFSGAPFLADVQSAIFYPPALLTLALSSLTGGFSFYALELEAVAHFWLTSLFAYFFARRLFDRSSPALITALVWSYGGYLTAYPTQQLAILETQTWLPLILLLLDWGIERGKSSYFVGAGLCLGLVFLAGHPQSALYVVYLSVAYLIFRSFHPQRLSASVDQLGDKSVWKKWAQIRYGLLFLLTGLAVAAAQLLPSLEYARLSVRTEIAFWKLAGGFPPRDLLQMLIPGSVSVMAPLYAGLLPLSLVGYALYVRRDQSVAFWGGVAAVALLLSLGRNTFLYPLFYWLAPGFNLFRSQERAAFIVSFALAVLAGYGLMSVVEPKDKIHLHRSRHYTWGLAYGALLIASLIFAIGWGQAHRTSAVFDQLWPTALLLAGITAVSLTWWSLQALPRSLSPVFLVNALATLIIAADLFLINQDNVMSGPPAAELAPVSLVKLLRADDRVFRVENEWRLPGNYGCLYGIEDTWGASPLRPARYQAFWDAMPRQRKWQLLNVGYVLTWQKTLDTASTLVAEIPKGETTYLHRLAKPGPRAWAVYQIETISDDTAALTRLAESSFDPFTTAILAADPDVTLSSESPPATVSILDREPGRLTLQVDMPAPGVLVISEMAYPGWRALVDGHPTRLWRADVVLQAVILPTGHHWIELSFQPWTPWVGLAISSLAVVLALVCLFHSPKPKGNLP